MRSSAIATVVAVLGTVVATAGSGAAVAGTGPRGPEPVYVFNLHGAEEGRADQRPTDLVLSENSSISEVTWSKWGPQAALGTGKLTGTWCLPDCETEPYTATVLLGSVQRMKGKRYFAHFGVSGDFPEPEDHIGALIGELPTPEQAGRTKQADRTERTDRADRADRAEQTGRAEHSGRAEQGGRTEQSRRAEHSGRAEQAGRAERGPRWR
ncbi:MULTISPECIES: hypothetical protein [Streptosporangium]|uniref:Lipoprotein n=1 Tax=Streptosporangium brasiliense TaxID=47480 RepID=A0ABT9R3F6_9ACTN|nr:hypothetical protein [Streptosporangium brasiliense]MDP9863344.1 hypothetical protein [Streptosporangium brasiliense]